MVIRQLLAIVVCFPLAGCLHRSAQLAPIACPADSLPASAPSIGASAKIKIDGPPPTALFKGAYTVVVDDQILVIVRTDADTVALLKAWKSLDMATVKSIDVIRAPRATVRYPNAVGDVLRIARCY
jgi:hypothetical protein